MKHVSYCHLAVAVSLLALQGACVPDNALTPKVESTLDAALADVSHPALDFVSKFFSGGIGIPTIRPTRCSLDSASQSFVCSPLAAAGQTLTQRFSLLDATGGKQSGFDPASTNALHLENSVVGSWPDMGTATVDGQQNLDLTGLGSPRHTLNGTSLTITSVGPPGFEVTGERRTTITDLVLPVVVAGAPPGWPLSGTIDIRSRKTNRPDDPDVFIATMRFDGSSVVTLTLTVPGGVQTCRVNLTSMPPGGIGCPVGSPAVPVGLTLLPGKPPALR
jgi:hypothetical protein